VLGSPGKWGRRRARAAEVRVWMRWARAGSVFLRLARPSRSRAASPWEMGKMPWQHCEQPGRQARCGPAREVASARARSTIWRRLLMWLQSGKAEADARAVCAQKGAEMSGEGLGLLAEDAVEDGVHVLELAGVVEGAGELGGGEAGGNLGDLGDLVPEDEVFFPGAHGVGLD